MRYREQNKAKFDVNMFFLKKKSVVEVFLNFRIVIKKYIRLEK